MPDPTCPICATPVSPASRFCPSCGASLEEANQAVGAAVAATDRLSDSGAIQLRALLVEATHGEYEIGDELGRGGMGIVFRAREVHLHRTVAIKVLPPDLTFGKGVIERFQREARTAASLDHPNIIPIYRISSGGRLFWYAMKFLEGHSLADVLAERGQLSVIETVAILEQVADALDYAHQRRVVHRDIKPHNVMLDDRGRVILTDFGIAKDVTTTALTGSGAIIGTPFYMSPEQCRGGTLTGAADQYSVGVMTYQMIAGHVPFDADSAIDVIQKHCQEPPPPLDLEVPGLPKHVVNAVSRSMAKKAGDRFVTVMGFVKGLKNEAPAEDTVIMSRRSLAHRISGLMLRRPRSVADAVARLTAALALVGGLVAGSVWLATRQSGSNPAAQRTLPRPDSAPGLSPPSQAATQPAASSPRAAGAPRPPSPAREGAGRTTASPPPVAGDGGATGTAAAARGYVRISVRPYANITIAGRTIEERLGWADSLPPGQYTVVFERDGYETLRRTVVVRAGREATLAETLRPRRQP